METSPEYNESQSRDEAMAETLNLLEQADGWATLCVATDKNGELTGATKLHADPDQLTALMVGAGLNIPAFGRAILRAAVHLSRMIDSLDKPHDTTSPSRQ